MDNFDFTGAFDGPLIPSLDQLPVFDSVVMCSPNINTFLIPSSDAKQDASPSAALATVLKSSSRTSQRKRGPNLFPLPPNPFTSALEEENRPIANIIAHCWSVYPESEKQVWRDKEEKRQRRQRYPKNRFGPAVRGNGHILRDARGNGVEDVKR